MKSIIFKYGLYSLFTAIVLFALVLIFGRGLSHGNQEALTYGTMVLSLSFVFFGIQSYKINEVNGRLSFLEALKIGLLISLFASLGIAAMDILYTSVINPDWGAEYIEESLKQMGSLPKAEFEKEKAALIQQMEDYGHPLFMGALMFISTMIIGIIITFISSLILKSK